jgi:hypothetical protein
VVKRTFRLKSLVVLVREQLVCVFLLARGRAVI